MKKIILICLLAAGCTRIEVFDVNTRTSEYIGLDATTTRATVSNLATIQTDPAGFNVWATGGENPAAWHTDGVNAIDGTNNHIHTDGKWSFENPVKWPRMTEGYPMRFYAIYPSGVGAIEHDFASGTSLRVEYSPPAPAAQQIDMLAAKTVVNAMPMAGIMPLTFNHILSKIALATAPGAGAQVDLIAADMANAAHTGHYDMVAGQWNSPAGSGVYLSPDGGPFMLLPQTLASWMPESGSAPTASSGGYIALTYRMTIGGQDEVGLADALSHPDNDGTITGPLFVRAGFPLPANSVWEAGKSYTYTINLGTTTSCNGHILDEYYCDAAGEPTPLRLVEVRDEGKHVGDKLSDGAIHIMLETTDWLPLSSSFQNREVTVGPRVMRLPATAQNPATQTLNVVCPTETQHWSLTSSDPSWLLLSPNADGSNAAPTLAGTQSATIYPVATQNTAGTIRTTHILLDDDDVVSTISQNSDIDAIPGAGTLPNTGQFITYVGAFWRHDEVGERIIRINAGTIGSNRTTWSARVAWLDPRWGPDDGVLLLAGPSDGSTVGSPTLSAHDANAENFPIIGGSEYIEAGPLTAPSPDLVFRIGLKTPYTPTVDHPARYAVVVIEYGQNPHYIQKIFLRQGEHDDFLMTAADPVSTGNIASRTRTVRFSPYNLTGNLDTPLDPGGTWPQSNPGRFVDFPTQAGAMFQWASNSERHVWPPTGTITGWNLLYPSVYWHALAARHEGCPAGYRRPEDGPTSKAAINSTDISQSEVRQSLWFKPQRGNTTNNLENSVWGYYADGYFDRREITTSATGTAGTAVEATGNGAAYIGRLFFNPVAGSDRQNASIFFPASGYRQNYGTGAIASTGIAGHYWSASANSTTMAWDAIRIRSDRADQMLVTKNSGASIRCVRR